MVPVKNQELKIKYEIASKEDLIGFKNEGEKPVVVKNSTSSFSIDILAKMILVEINPIAIIEGDCKAELKGCFSKQFGENKYQGHNPNTVAAEYKKYHIDHISITLDKNKDYDNGSLILKIPVGIYCNNNEIIKSEVIQEFRLKNKTLTIFKGGCELFTCNVALLKK